MTEVPPVGSAPTANGGCGSSPRKRKSMAVEASLCVLCTLVGAFYPAMVDWSKTATERWAVSVEGGVVWQEARAYPFSPVTVVLANGVIQVALGTFVVCRKMGARAFWSDSGLVLRMLPLGVVYAVGELLTLRSVQKASGPVYVVIANMKLVVAAVMSRVFFGPAKSMPALQWLELVLISLAAAGYTIAEAGATGGQLRWEGASAALAKSSLVAFSSVFCEHSYKSNPFYLTLTLQAMWGLVSVVLLIALGFSGLAATGVAEELHDIDGHVSLFGGGPSFPMCDSGEHAECLQWLAAAGTSLVEGQAFCRCVTARGWDTYTIFTVLADLINAVSSALVFKKLSAVAKYVCRATSAVPMYIFYCAVGRSSWRLQTFAIVVYLCVQVSIYTVQRHRAEEKPDAGWVQAYSAVHGAGKTRTA